MSQFKLFNSKAVIGSGVAAAAGLAVFFAGASHQSDVVHAKAQACLDDLAYVQYAKENPEIASEVLGMGYLPFATLFPVDAAKSNAAKSCAEFDLSSFSL